MVMSFLPMESRYSSCATNKLLLSSSTAPPSRTIRCTCNRTWSACSHASYAAYLIVCAEGNVNVLLMTNFAWQNSLGYCAHAELLTDAPQVVPGSECEVGLLPAETTVK